MIKTEIKLFEPHVLADFYDRSLYLNYLHDKIIARHNIIQILISVYHQIFISNKNYIYQK